MKILSILLLIPSLSLAALTKAQVITVEAGASQMASTASQLDVFATNVLTAINNGNVYSINFSTNAIALTIAQQNDIVARYQYFKTQLQNQLDALP